MKKRDVILHTAIASALLAMAAGAQAGGSLSATATKFATQNFGATSTAALEIVPAALGYVYSTPGGIVVNPTGVVNMYFRLGAGTFTTAPIASDFAGSVVTVLGLAVGTPVLSTDKTTIVVPLSNTTASNITIGVGATLNWTPAAGRAVSGVNAILNTAGATLSATASASVLAANANAAALPADIDGPATTAATFATGASAITASVTATGATETQKIDVTASPSQTKMTTGVNSGTNVKINFGSFAFTDVALVYSTNGATLYSVANNGGATGVGAIATGNFAAAPSTGLVLASDAGCATPMAAGSVATLSGSNTVATWTGVTKAASGTATYVCMTVSGTTVIPTTTPTLQTSLTVAPTTGTNITGSGTLFALGLNGASIDVRSYVPAAAVGYSSFVRIVNSGTTSAAISVAVIDQATGVAGASSVLGTLAGGAAKTYVASDIETALGVSLTATLRPRLRITAPTSSLQVQSFMSSPNGVFSDMSGGQLSNPTPAVTITGN